MTVFRAATLRTFFFAFHAGAKELTSCMSKMLFYCENLHCLPEITTRMQQQNILTYCNNGKRLEYQLP